MGVIEPYPIVCRAVPGTVFRNDPWWLLKPYVVLGVDLSLLYGRQSALVLVLSLSRKGLLGSNLNHGIRALRKLSRLKINLNKPCFKEDISKEIRKVLNTKYMKI